MLQGMDGSIGIVEEIEDCIAIGFPEEFAIGGIAVGVGMLAALS